MAVPAGVFGCEPADDHVGPEGADHPDDIAEDFFFSPEGERLYRALRIAEIDGRGEELLGAVDPAGGQQLLGSDQPDFGSLLRADQVLAAFTARQRQVGGPVGAPLGKISKNGRILIVRMSADIKNAPENVQLGQSDLQLRGVGDPFLLRPGERTEKERRRSKFRK